MTKIEHCKVVYVTSQAPYGNGEIWALHEIQALIAADVDIIIVPRTSAGKALHRAAELLLPRTLNSPFFSLNVLKSLVKLAICQPLFFSSLCYWIAKQSNRLIDFAKGIFVLPKSIWLAKQLADKNITHIHAFSTTNVAVVAYILSKMLCVPWSFTLHTSVVCNSRYRRSGNAHLDSAKFARLSSGEVHARLADFMGNAYLPKFQTVHLGVDCSKKPHQEKQKQMNFVIASVGGLLPYKGHEYSLKAARTLKERGISNFKWTFFGEGPLREYYMKLINDWNIQDVMDLPGTIPNDRLMNLYEKGSINAVVLSSVLIDGIQEGIPVALMEAMSAGIPVISTDSGGTLELIGNEAGIFVPQRDSNALADAIEKLMSSSDYREQIGIRGRLKVESDFNLQKNCRVLKDLYCVAP